MAKYAPSAPDATTASFCTTTELFSVTRMARLLEVSTSGYYAWKKRAVATELTPRRQRRADLAVKVLDVHADSDGTYGSPRITSELRDRGETVNEKTVAAIMAEIPACYERSLAATAKAQPPPVLARCGYQAHAYHETTIR